MKIGCKIILVLAHVPVEIILIIDSKLDLVTYQMILLEEYVEWQV